MSAVWRCPRRVRSTFDTGNITGSQQTDVEDQNGYGSRLTGRSPVPQIADDFVHCASRQRWAKRVNRCTAAIFAPARRGRDMRFFARPAHVRIFRAATGVTPVPYRDRPPGQPIACFRRSERRPSALSPWPSGWRRVQSRSTLSMYSRRLTDTHPAIFQAERFNRVAPEMVLLFNYARRPHRGRSR
jgi:hypothetical protein